MKKFLLLTFIISFNTMAGPSRAPAVEPKICNLNISTTTVEVVNGQSIEVEKPIKDAQAELCKAVKQCMYSADEDKMEGLKNLEAIACNNIPMKSVTIKNPSSIIDPSYNGKRDPKKDSVTTTSVTTETEQTTATPK
jgi:hypothetical protein